MRAAVLRKRSWVARERQGRYKEKKRRESTDTGTPASRGPSGEDFAQAFGDGGERAVNVLVGVCGGHKHGFELGGARKGLGCGWGQVRASGRRSSILDLLPRGHRAV